MIHRGSNWAVINDDCLNCGVAEGFQRMGELAGSFDVFFADPPYNYKLNYGAGIEDSRTEDAYLGWCFKWLWNANAALRKGGAMWLMFPTEWIDDIAVFCKRTLGYDRRNWIIWHERFGVQTSHKFSRCHRHILYLVKPGGEAYFDPSLVMVPSLRQLIYKDKRANPKGRVAPDVWEFPRLCGTHKERDGRVPTQLPEAITYRMVQATCPVGGKVLEFFAGSGSCGRSVLRAGMGKSYEGWEQSADTALIAASRIREAETLEGQPPPNTRPEECVAFLEDTLPR